MLRNPRLLVVLLLPAFMAAQNVTAQDGVWTGDIRTYAQHCAEVIGEPVPDFNCSTDGHDIPIFDHGQTASSFNPAKCDRPAALSDMKADACRIGSKFGVLRGQNPDVSSTFICRKKDNGGAFDEIAVIQFNAANGATCWFRGTLESTDDADLIAPAEREMEADIASPTRSIYVNDHSTPATPRITWHSLPRFGCVSCHDIEPIIVSPYIAELEKRGLVDLPSFYDKVTVNDLRVWNPMHPAIDGFFLNDLMVFDSTSEAAKCTQCHALARQNESSGGRFQFLLHDSVGQKGHFTTDQRGATVDTNQQARAKNPAHAWMHVDRPPFELAPPSAATLRAYDEIKRCTAAPVPGLCRYIQRKGRPPKGVEMMGVTPPDGTILSAGASLGVAARMLNHDLGDRLKWSVAKPSGNFSAPLWTAHEGRLSLPVNCRAGEVVAVSAQIITATGVVEPAVSTRTYPCVASRLEFFDSVGRTVAALADPDRSGGLYGGRGIGFGTSELFIGDRNNGLQYRSFLSFPLTVPFPSDLTKAELVFRLAEHQGRVAANFGDARVFRVDLEDDFDIQDFDRSSLIQRGMTRFTPSLGLHQIDVTQHILAALETGATSVDLGIWLSQVTDGDRAFDMLRILNQPRTGAPGEIDFNTTLQPVLKLTY